MLYSAKDFFHHISDALNYFISFLQGWSAPWRRDTFSIVSNVQCWRKQSNCWCWNRFDWVLYVSWVGYFGGESLKKTDESNLMNLIWTELKGYVTHTLFFWCDVLKIFHQRLFSYILYLHDEENWEDRQGRAGRHQTQ